MPRNGRRHEAPRCGEAFDEGNEHSQDTPHCTWCKCIKRRQPRYCQCGRVNSCSRGDNAVAAESRYSRGGEAQTVLDDSDDEGSTDSSNNEAATQKCGTKLGQNCDDINSKKEFTRGRSNAQPQIAAANVKPAAGPFRSKKVPNNYAGRMTSDRHPTVDTACGAIPQETGTRQIVMEARCPCLCAYLHLRDTAAVCEGRRPPLSPTNSSETSPVDKLEDRLPPSSVPGSGNEPCKCMCCRIARRLSKHKTASVLNTGFYQPTKLSPKKDAPSDVNPTLDSRIEKDGYGHQGVQRRDKRPSKYCNGTAAKGAILEETTIEKSRLSNLRSERRALKEGSALCRKCRSTIQNTGGSEMQQEDCVKRETAVALAEEAGAPIRSICVCDRGQRKFKKFPCLKRMCVALTGRKTCKCSSDCHRTADASKQAAADAEILTKRDNRRSGNESGVADRKPSLAKSGLLTFKYEILSQKEIDKNGKEVENGLSFGENTLRQINHEHGILQKHSHKETKGKKQKNSPERKEKGLSSKRYAEQHKTDGRVKTDKIKFCSCRKYGDRYLRRGDPNQTVSTSEDEQMVATSRYPRRNTKLNLHGNNKHKLSTVRGSPAEDAAESSASARDQSPQSGHDVGRKLTGRNRTPTEVKPMLRSDNPGFQGKPLLEPVSSEVIRIGNGFYEAACHRTEHIKVTSFRELRKRCKTRGHTHHKRSPKVEVRLKFETTSSEEDLSENSLPRKGPIGEAHSRNTRKTPVEGDTKQSTAQDTCVRPQKKAEGSRTKQLSRKRVCALSPAIPTVSPDRNGDHRPPSPPALKCTKGRRMVGKMSPGETTEGEDIARAPKSRTEVQSENNGESPEGYKSQDGQRSEKELSDRTLQLKRLSSRWFANPGEEKPAVVPAVVSDDAQARGVCDVRPFTASSSGS